MATVCAVLNDDFLKDCDNKPVGGAEALMAAIPKSIWDAATIVYSSANPNVIQSITLPTGKKAFKFEVFKKGHKPKFETQDTDFGSYYKHSITTNISTWNQATKDQIPALADGYNVFIVENVNKASGGIFYEIYGAQNGLRMPDGVRDLAANEGVFTGTFTNDADMNEPKPPLTFQPLTAGYSAAKAAFLALFVLAS